MEPEELQKAYSLRFAASIGYRRKVWETLVRDFFQEMIPTDCALLDLGCGYGEFINPVRAGRKFGMDLNPDAPRHLDPEVTFLPQDCSTRWDLDDSSLDRVFTSNFLEHLPTKAHVKAALSEARRSLKPDGRIICLGPNVRYLPGRYWDFWDHHLPISDLSLQEALRLQGFAILRRIPRFLPYTIVHGFQPPPFLARLYLRLPLLWPIFGKQFLVLGENRKGSPGEDPGRI